MTDLTEALSSIITDACPGFQPRAGNWTPERLRALLDANGQTHRVSKKSGRDEGTQFDLARCPFCGESEGNPAVWTVDGIGCFRCFRENAGCSKRTFADVLAKFQPRAKLPRISALELPRKYPHARQSVVTGLLRRGDVVNVIGGPKARKSFFVEQLALSIAAGVSFLGYPTVAGKVLLIDNELRGDDLAQRLTGMAAAMSLNWQAVASNIDIMPLRGTLADLNAIHDELCNLPPDSYSLVIVDALYKVLPSGTDENSNSNMTACYVLFDESAERQNCAVTIVHHTSKGAQHQKSVSDMGAGAGAQSRSADCHIVLREHEAADTVVMQAIIRSQKPIEPVCLTFDYPIWKVAADKNPDDVAVANRKPTATIEAFLATLPAEHTPKTDALLWSKKHLGVAKTTVQLLLQEAVKRGLVEVIEPKNKRMPKTIRRIEPVKAAA